MQAFTLYGLDENERAVSVEILRAEDVEHGPRQLARERLKSFVAVEVWRGPARLVRMTQRRMLQ